MIILKSLVPKCSLLFKNIIFRITQFVKHFKTNQKAKANTLNSPYTFTFMLSTKSLLFTVGNQLGITFLKSLNMNTYIFMYLWTSNVRWIFLDHEWSDNINLIYSFLCMNTRFIVRKIFKLQLCASFYCF